MRSPRQAPAADYESLPEGTEGIARSAGLPVDPYRIWTIIKRNRRQLAMLGATAALLGVLGAKFLVGDTYQAYSIIVFEGLPEIAGLPSRGRFEFETLVNEVRLPENLRKAGKKVNLAAPAHLLFKRVDVEYAPNSNLVSVGAKADGPEKAAEFANQVVDTFLKHRIFVEKSRIAEHLKTTEQDLEVARVSAAEARKAYDQFREQEGIADLSTETEQAIEAAADLQAEANLAGAEAMAEKVRSSRSAEAQRRIGSTTILSERRSSPVREEMSRVRTELAQARARLSEEHPRVQALQQQLSHLRSQPPAARQAVSDRMVGLNPTYQAVRESAADSEANQQAAQEREAALSSLVENARERVAQLSRVEGQASKLLATVQVAEDHVARLEAQRGPAEDELRAPSTGFRIAEQAVPPEVPLRSRKKMMVAGAVPLATIFLAACFFLFGEFRGFRVVTPLEVSYWGRAPVVGATVWPRDPDALHDFIGELDDYTSDVTGRTLVVGVSVDAIQLAGALATGLRETVAPLMPAVSHDQLEPAGYLTAGDRPFMENTVAMPPEAMDIPVVGMAGESPWDVDDGTDELQPGVAAHTVPLDDRGLGPSFREPTAIVGADALPLFEVSVHAAIDAASSVEAWDGPDAGPALRRAARLADRVLVVVPAGSTSAMDLQQIPGRLGRNQGIGYAIVDLDPQYLDRPDRAGDVDDFWFSYKD